MKLDKAIEIQTAMRDKTHVYSELEIRDALKLGIEAMKRLQIESPYPHAYSRKLLPGETKE